MIDFATLAEPIEAFGVEYPKGLRLRVVETRDFGIQVEFPMPEGGFIVGTLTNKYVEERHG